MPKQCLFLIHAAREISTGLRSVFGVDNPLERGEEGHHKQSILVSLGFSDFEGLAQDWYKISSKLSEYAHGHGAWKMPRTIDQVRPLWDQFENLLERLVGSYYAIIKRIERISSISNVNIGVVETLHNILLIPVYYNYFFRNEKDIKWFNPLNQKGWFSPQQINFDQQNNASFWNILDYLERVSEQLSQNLSDSKRLIEIIENIIQFSLHKKKINNPHIWSYCIKIINNLPAKVIKENLQIEQFQIWLRVWIDHSMDADLPINEIGEKVLPKFLHDDYGPEYKYAEMIIDAISQIKPSMDARDTKQLEDMALVGDSYWIRNTFKKYGRLIGQKCSLNVIHTLADRLNNALKFKPKNYYVNIEINDDVYQIWITRIVESEAGEIRFKENFYKCIVKQYSQEQLKDIDRQNNIWALYHRDPANELMKFDFTATNKTEIVSSIRQSLPTEIKWTNNDKFLKRLESVFDGLYTDYSSIWFKSLADGEQLHTDRADEILIAILRDVLLAKCETNHQDGFKILNSFLSEKYQFPIFHRFVLLCIDKYWEHYSEFLDKIIKLMPNILEESDFEVELYDILLHHNSGFNDAMKVKLKFLIDNGPTNYLEKDEKLFANWKFQKLSPLHENPDFRPIYEEIKQKVNPKDGKPYEPKRSPFEGGFVAHKSPISKEEILQKPIIELLKYFNEFKEADFWQGTLKGVPDKEGLAEALRAAVKDVPEKFLDEIDLFLDADYYYFHRLLWGLREAWEAGKELDWKKLIDFIVKYFERDKAIILEKARQAQGEDYRDSQYIWIVDEIVDLVHDGCKDNKRSFDLQYFDLIDKIFDLILPLLRGESHPSIQGDALRYALNTTLGRTIMSYISFSLYAARVKNKSSSWGKERYEKFITKGIEAYVWFGCYLPQMHYLDNEYTKEKIEYFTPKPAEDFEWRMFMEGYLAVAQVSEDIYLLMRESYIKGLSGKIFEEKKDQRLVQHICLGYLYSVEQLSAHNENGKESLFWKMLTEAGKLGTPARWLEVPNYFWSLSGFKEKQQSHEKEKHNWSEENEKKILAFWDWTFNNPEIVKLNLGDDYNSFLGRMTNLIIYLDKIGAREEEWLLLCAPHVDRWNNGIRLIEYLAKFEDEESIKRIGRIFKRVLENITPNIRQEEIKLIVSRIYEKGNRADAEAICNTYGRRDIHFLKPIWEHYQEDKIQKD